MRTSHGIPRATSLAATSFRLAAASAFLASTAALSLSSLPAEAQSYTVLHAFETPAGTPSVSVQGPDGSLYGTTYYGGAGNSGTVFKITPSGTLTTLYSFSGSDGNGPIGLVKGTDGNFYGTTYLGGAQNTGTVFKMTPTGTLTTLYVFLGSDGRNPSAGLVQGTDGSFYGTTYLGGASDLGTVFRITSAGTVTTLHSFLGGDGSHPAAPLAQGIDGSFYGTTLDGGAVGTPEYPFGFGTVFKITPAGAFTTLYSFVSSYGGVSPYSGVGGQYPYAGLTPGTDGNLYGTASSGGAGHEGTVFSITPSGTLTTLYSFSGDDGSFPRAGLVQGTDGNFYGTTGWGGSSRSGTPSAGYGTVFRITPGGVLTTLHSFLGGDGIHPYAGLVQGTDGSFYGTTSLGGPSWYVSSWSGHGTVFRITPGGVLTTLHSFAGTEGQKPTAPLVQGTDGDFYGTTSAGGAYGLSSIERGTVYKITPGGVLTTLYSFASEEANQPDAGLMQGTDGNFYGTTTLGGLTEYEWPRRSYGSVFRITPGGTLTTLHSFVESEYETPYAGLVQGTDGSFFGTTYQGGWRGTGTVFKITPAGAFTTLHMFFPSDGYYPLAGLAQGTDGNFYGTTTLGGANDKGAVFSITPSGSLTALHSFSGSDGQRPVAELLPGRDGDFYGTTYEGGTHDSGTVFRITPAGALTTLYSFTGGDGAYPYAGLVQGTDGSFYGTTGLGGASDRGTVFSITPAGTLTTLHSFAGIDGSSPRARLVQGSDGNLYGTAAEGGPLKGGVVFRLTLGPGPAPAVTAVSPSRGPSAGGTPVTISGTDLQPGATVSFGGVPASNVTFIDAMTIRALTPAHVAGVVAVAVANPDARVGSLPSAYAYADGSSQRPPPEPPAPHPLPPDA